MMQKFHKISPTLNSEYGKRVQKTGFVKSGQNEEQG